MLTGFFNVLVLPSLKFQNHAVRFDPDDRSVKVIGVVAFPNGGDAVQLTVGAGLKTVI
jgi:hypothetical protein